jgi:hypothetical protein
MDYLVSVVFLLEEILSWPRDIQSNQSVNVDSFFLLLLLPLPGHLHRRIIVLIVILLIVHVGDVQYLIINSFITVVDLLPGPVAPTVLLIRVGVFGLNSARNTVSLNQEGISLSFISL